MREALLLGLWEYHSHEIRDWNQMFRQTKSAASSLPMIPLPVAAVMGAAAIVIRNPVVTRRWLPWRLRQPPKAGTP